MTNSIGQARVDSFGKFYFIDSEANVATFEVNALEVQSLANLYGNEKWQAIFDELSRLGFRFSRTSDNVYSVMFEAIRDRQKRIIEEQKTAQTEKFDF